MTRAAPSLAPARALAAVLFAASSAVGQTAPPVDASGDGLRLNWTRTSEASSCPDAPAVEADVKGRLGWDPFEPDAARSIDVHVTRENGVWRALIDDRTASGTLAGSRLVTSSAESCASLASAAALGIALIVRTSTPAPPVAPAPTQVKVASPVATATPPQARDQPHAVVFGAAVGALSVLPKASFGPSLIGRLPVAEHFSLTGSGVFLPEVKTTGNAGTYAFGATWAGIGACYVEKLGEEVSVVGCASLELGSLHVVVFDPTPVSPGGHLWGAGAIGPALDWNPSQALHVLFGVDLLVPFARRTFAVEHAQGTQTIYEQPPVGALFTLGVGVEP